MNRSFQSILLGAGFVLCLSLAMTADPYETTDHISIAGKPEAVKSQSGTAADNSVSDKNREKIPTHDNNLEKAPTDGSNLSGIHNEAGQAYDLRDDMYTIRRGGTERVQANGTERIQTGGPDPVQASGRTTDTDAGANAAKAAETASDNKTQNAGASIAKAGNETANHSETETIQAKAQSEDELDLLARLITAEAQGEPYDAKVAVGAVVMNRVKSDEFANTIKGVIYENIDGYYQFTPVVNGWIDKPAQPDCLEAAREAISGSDPTNGALFFYDNQSTNAWLLEKPVSIKSGNMIFAY